MLDAGDGMRWRGAGIKGCGPWDAVATHRPTGAISELTEAGVLLQNLAITDAKSQSHPVAWTEIDWMSCDIFQ